MSAINSWCGRFCISSFILIISILIFDYKANILPINGIWLALYMFFIIISSVWISCVLIQKILQQNQVLEFDFDSNRYLKLFKSCCQTLYVPINFDFISTKTVSKCGSDTPKINKKVFDVIDSIPILKQKISYEPEKNIDDRIEEFTNDIEQRFIVKWYKYISDDDSFSNEAKVLLDSVTRRILQVSVQVDSDKIFCGALVILLKHLKEYRKAVKRANKNGHSLEDVYRYAHIGNKSETAFEHYTHQLTANVLREFISWELWNSLPSRLLVSILSKRLTSYAIRYISQPGFINYRLLSLFASEKTNSQLNLTKYAFVSIYDVNYTNKLIKNSKNETKIEKKSNTPQLTPKKETKHFPSEVDILKIDTVIQSDPDSIIEVALTKMITQHTAPILQRAAKPLQEKEIETPPISIKTTPEHKPIEYSPKRSEPVKIHSAKSSKRYEDTDIINGISVGQDLLAFEGIDSSDLQSFSGRRLWGPSLSDQEIDKNHPLWDINEDFKDRDSLEDDKLKESPKIRSLEKDKKGKEGKGSPPIVQSFRTTTTNAASIITNTIKPIGNLTATTVHNMRELQQSTVNNVVKPVSNATEKAIHKFGDLQDEAVGVVEGIFDFGMAGLRKGLRLTGLQDSVEKPKQSTTPHTLTHQKSIEQSPKNAPKLVKVGHITSEDIKKSSESMDSSVWINPLAKESPNGFENTMLFEKSPIEIIPDKNNDNVIVPDISTEASVFFTESPEYEETADLASTISKLRSLLQQKSSESSLNTPAASPMPIEDKSCHTPNEQTMNDAIRNDGGMQRFARTVTGMFNTFKGALPGNTETSQAKNDQWLYIENELSETDLPSLLNSLLIERRDYCTIDTAYEAMDSLDLLTEAITSPVKKIKWDNQTFEDELDDFDGSVPITKVLLDVLCECFMDTNCALKQEPIIKSILVMTGRKFENILSAFAFKILRYINKSVGPLPKNDNDLPLPIELATMVTILTENLPSSIKSLFGENDIKTAINFFVSSLQNQKINQDIVLQLFELICSQLIYSSSQMSPTPSA